MARTSDEKIALMYEEYGKFGGCRCRSCPHIDVYTNEAQSKIWYKCKMFGESSGEATDWRCGNEACKAFIIPPEEAERRHLYGEVFRRVKGLRPKKQPEMDSNQIMMEI